MKDSSCMQLIGVTRPMLDEFCRTPSAKHASD